MIEFVAYGHPQPKGSMTRMPNGAMVGGRTSRAKDAEVRRAHRKRILGWPIAVYNAALVACHGRPAIFEPVNVCAVFYMVRPATKKYRDAIYCAQKPDYDKLLRGVFDPMVKAGLFADDKLVVMSNGSEKRYAAAGAQVGDPDGPRVEIRVTRVKD